MPLQLSNGQTHYHFWEAPVTPEVQARFDAEVAHWSRKYPALFSAPQPEPLPKEYGRHSLHMTKEWPGVVESFRPREAVSRNLIRLEALGNCLSPIIEHGDALYVDTEVVPEVGDICVVLVTPEILSKFFEYSEQVEAFRAQYGAIPSPLVTKLLGKLGSNLHCCTNNSAFSFDGCKTLGVVVRIERGGCLGVAGVAGAASSADIRAGGE